MEQIGTASGAHPNLNLTPEEKRVYGNLLKEADPDGFGAVSGDVAVKFFERTRLPPDVLGQIWQIADTENRGFLTPAGFGVVLRLIGHAQAGRQPSTAIAPSPAPLPKFDTIPGQAAQQPQPQSLPAQQLAQQNSGTPSSPSSGPGPVRVPALSPDKVAEYSGLFDKSGAENGQLNGMVAKQIFERARLPIEVLGRIWNLADTQGRGSLDVSEFVIAMHLLASYKSGAMRGVPNTLPPGLLDAASRRAPSRLSAGQVPGRPTSSAGPPQMQPQFTGMQTQPRPQSPMVNRQLATGTPLSAQSTGEPWMINAADKARFDSVFATVDTAGQGFISGEQAVQFFGNARLPEEVLAQVWDLADINSDGLLNRDEFAVAMYLIRQQRGSHDGRVPQSLPAALVPPSMRKQVQPSAPQTIPVFDDAPVTKPRSAADDLFGLDVSDQPSQQPALAQRQVAQSTGGTDAGPFANPKSPVPASSPPPSTMFKPFVPSSSFGQGLMPQATGMSNQGQTKEANLMDEEDDTAPPKINNDAAELGNLSNQVGNLSKQMQDVSSQRAQAQTELSQTSQQKEAFQQRLTQLRAAYDQTVAQVKSLKDQLAASQGETKRLQQDMAMIEGTHADLRTQHQQLASALAADQQENASLKKRIRQTNAENEQFKPQIEKLKSDARQQKGLVAINKKQLATNEAERDRIKAEIAAAQHEIEIAKRETEESAKQVEQSHRELQEAKETPMPAPVTRELSPQPQVVSPQSQVASPTPSMNSSNPFFRRQDSGAVFSPPMGSAMQSPTLQHEQDRNNAFDSIFGPSFGAATGPAPTTSFGRDTPEVGEPAQAENQRVAEPPDPPRSAQIQSSALPMRSPMLREHSINSSMRANQDEGRLSQSQTPRALTPDTSTASPASHKADDPFTASATDEEQEAVRQTLPREEPPQDLEKVDSVPGAFPGSRSETPAPVSVNPTAVALGACAATIVAGAGVAAAVGSQEEKKNTPPAEQKDEFDDIFGQPSHKKTLSEQRADFDSAFTTMDSSAQPTNGQPGAANQEFPDIHEVEDDDESSDDDSEPRGFDDHFAPPQSSTAAGKQPENPPSLAPPPFETRVSSSTLPDIDSQQSPPGYRDAVQDDNPNHFPMEYKNLLPAREDPTSPPLPTAGGSSHPGPDPAGMPPAYGPESGSRSQSQSEVKEAPPTKAAPFDFDSAFANMGEAPVADDSDSEYDEHTPPATKPPQDIGFDPSFDSPASLTSTTNTMAQSTRGFSAHDAVTNPAPNGTWTASPTGPAGAGFADSDHFSSNPYPPSRQQTLQSTNTTSPASATATSASHDWDSLFATIDSQTQASSRYAVPTGTDRPSLGADRTSGAPLTKTTTAGSDPQGTEIGDGLTANTTAEAIPNADTPPAPSTALPQTPVAPPSPPVATVPLPPHFQPQIQKIQRPQPGRALTQGTEHDDPILKRLTAMGWSRDESLEALEKFDYNIDKAADYLTFKS
ncbi:hypothetical protein LTR70_008603 [Exophiala xenobiotica]|uniref:Actin cytoskeleton-regulatory complex protein END3 n=1 Tax=Lithohypha guttulata TaxID=1690604 RepID=A0ABR0K1F6_9EURO|nr:hypothetical protein LTR24_008312 [Lithohypha guttulata]KAK5311744.1 hypothetical protein LTR70_008603 [Exophiala xenobiotica]